MAQKKDKTLSKEERQRSMGIGMLICAAVGVPTAIMMHNPAYFAIALAVGVAIGSTGVFTRK